MPYILHPKEWDHVETLHVPPEQLSDGRHILLFHLSEARTRAREGRRNFGQLDHSGDGHVAGHVRGRDVDELGHVRRTTVVHVRGDRCGDHDSGSVYSLEGALEVTLPGNLFDEAPMQTLGE